MIWIYSLVELGKYGKHNIKKKSYRVVVELKTGITLKFPSNNLSNPDRINLNVLTEITSLNSPERTGVYYVTGNNIGALPPGLSNYGILLCMRSPYSLHPTNSNCVYVQEYTDVYGKHASRSFNNGAWTNWTTTATKDDLPNIFTAKLGTSNQESNHATTIKGLWNSFPEKQVFACHLVDSNNFCVFGFIYGDHKYGTVLYLAYNDCGIVKCNNGTFSDTKL